MTVWMSVYLWLFVFNFPSCNTEKEIVKEDVLPSTDGLAPKYNLKSKGKAWTRSEESPRYYQTCGTGLEADFWVTTQFINLSSTITDVIHVELEAELNLCDDPNQRESVSCYSNNFEVYIYHGNSTPNIQNSDQNEETLKDLLRVFSPLYNITNITSPGATLSRQIQRFFFYPAADALGLTLALRSRGACGEIFSMTMFYYYCKAIFMNSVRLKRTSAPRIGSKNVTADCSENSIASNNSSELQGHCDSNGIWSINDSFKCSCIEGYEPNSVRGCSLCSNEDRYKPDKSNSNCTECPLRTTANANKTSCKCKNDFYKKPSKKRDLSPCYGLLALKDRPTFTITASSVTVEWSKPDTTESLNEPVFYDIECFLCKKTICNLKCVDASFEPGEKNLTNTSVVVTKLTVGKKYVFRVYPKNSLNDELSKEKWRYKETNNFTFEMSMTTPNTSSGSDATGNIIIAVVAVLLFVLIIVLVIFACRRRGYKKSKQMESFLNTGVVDLPNVGVKPFVDPTNYSNPEEAVEEFANELDPCFIFLERLIGGGEFGDVYKGELTSSDGGRIPIAVKTLKHDADAKSSKDFLLEASVMAQFNNPNVVRMEGVVTKKKPHMIVIEYMSNGSLDNYLKANNGMLTRLQLLGMARGVAAGMNYLAEIKFVHRDLAARNVLVNDVLLCKISDFGLSRELEKTETSHGEYATSGGKIPIRWTAPEAIKYRKFSTASDVWSFGILLWEIMSFAQRPYYDWDNYKVMEEVDNGFRLPPPQKCPVGAHGLMLQCWKSERGERPSFQQITIVIDRWIRSPETLDDEVNFFITIGEWLNSIKMGSYKSTFIDAGYRKQSEVIDLTEEDLKKIGVSLIGHRNKIMKGIETLKERRQPTPLLTTRRILTWDI